MSAWYFGLRLRRQATAALSSRLGNVLARFAIYAFVQDQDTRVSTRAEPPVRFGFGEIPRTSSTASESQLHAQAGAVLPAGRLARHHRSYAGQCS